jgi:hypothetical protein
LRELIFALSLLNPTIRRPCRARAMAKSEADDAAAAALVQREAVPLQPDAAHLKVRMP